MNLLRQALSLFSPANVAFATFAVPPSASAEPFDAVAVMRAVFENPALPEFGERHLAAIRVLRVAWMPVESGAPCIDPAELLGHLEGQDDALAIAMRALGTQDPATACRTMAEVCLLLSHFVAEAGELAPGRYPLPKEMCEYFDFDHNGIDDSGHFTIEDAHLRLLRAAVWEEVDADSAADVLAEFDGAEMAWPFPFIDGKRPYGNSAFIQADMAELLGDPPYEIDDEGYPIEEPERNARYETLHYQTAPALQVFLLHASLRSGG